MLCVNLLLLTCLSIVGIVSEPESDWLHTACSGDGVCGPANSQCFEDGCMCAIGFYYSEGSRTCLDSCTDLDTDGYLMYANATINENIVYSNNGTEDDCSYICSKDPTCLSFEFSVGEPCKFHHVAASVSNWEVAGSYLFQRTCV
ncbi:uncharacterized protein [Littorina saxatilis]|uniref:Apple domain-containing protein n=1 Tax=Littorina saxatilis TaxID=31220 RepID=A0AAN9FZ16_9CAEN